MEACTHGCLCELDQRDIHIPVELPAQCRTVLELAQEWCGLQPPSAPRALHQPLEPCDVRTEHQGNPQHAFVADKAQLERRIPDFRRNERDEAVDGEENVLNGLARLAKNGPNRELNWLTLRKEAPPDGNRQRREQKVLRRRAFRR